MTATLWFWLDAVSGCGAVGTDARGVVRESCPYFARYRGRRFNEAILDLRERGLRVRWKRLETP